jgi:hypothetical protein
MRFHPVIFEAMDAAYGGESARQAERRAMYARPDAPPLPAEQPRRQGWLAAILGRRSAATAIARSARTPITATGND